MADKFLFIIFVTLGAISSFAPGIELQSIGAILSILLIPFISICYFFWFLVKRGVVGEIIKGIFITLAIVILGLIIPVVGQVFLFIFIIYNAIKTYSVIHNLRWHFLTSIIFYLSFLFPTPLGQEFRNPFIFFIPCLITSYLICFKLSKYNNGNYVFQMAMTLLSVPLSLLLMLSLASSLSRIFNVFNVIRFAPRTINVGEYMRGDSLVRAHTRTIHSKVTETVVEVSTGTAVKSGVERTVAIKIRDDDKRA